MVDFAQVIADRYNELSEDKPTIFNEMSRDSDFLNFGYWKKETKSVNEACENLMEELLKLIPEKRGTILDVAFGKGATTRYLLNYFAPENVVGINISEKQLQICREKLPLCRFQYMSATEMTFDDGSFDNVICVEASHHFDSREKFLKEAHRVLKPGGMLVLADVRARRSFPGQPPANFTSSLDEYRSVYTRSPFNNAEIVDVSEPCFGGIVDHYHQFSRQQFLKRKLPPKKWFLINMAYRLFRPGIGTSQSYLFVACRKD